MKREGWQHGKVRINRNKLLRVAAAADCKETAVVAKATKNSPNTTGKQCRRPHCAGCHHHPAVTKARDKAKGAHKLHACDVALNHRLLSWRVVGGGGAGIQDYKGTSASSFLAYLAGSGGSWHEDDDDGCSLFDGTASPIDGGLSDLYDLIVGRRADAGVLGGQEADPALATDIAVGDTNSIEEQEHHGDDVEEDGDEEKGDMGFCMVGITIAVEFSDDGEDWIVVEEI